MHRTGDADGAGKILAGVLGNIGGGGDHGGHAALHVRGAAAVHLSVYDLCAEGGVLPFVGVDDVHVVDMAVHENGLAGALAVDLAQNAAVAVDHDLIKAVGLHGFFQQTGYVLLFSGEAGDLDQLAAKIDKPFISVHSGKSFLYVFCVLYLREKA